MSIPESVAEAATVWPSEKFAFDGEATARRVILALAENLPESAVEKAWEAYCKAPKTRSIGGWKGPMRAAIIAAQKDVAGDSP